MPSLLSSLDQVEADLDELLACDPAGLPGATLAEVVQRQAVVRNRLAAFDARVTAAFDASKEWAADGSRSAAAWLVTKGRERKATVDRRVAHGRALRGMPLVWAAFARGEIADDHVDVGNLGDGREVARER